MSDYVKEVAISGLTLILTIALLKEINGVVLATGMSLIAGLAGYTIGKSKK